MFINRTFYHTPFHMRKAEPPQVHGVLHPQGFIDHANRLTVLSASVADEANGATDQQSYSEYMQLIEALSSLIDEAQQFSGLPFQLVQMREISVLAFVEKINAVQALVTDWEARRAAEKAEQAARAAAQVSRKRARSIDEDEVEYDMPAFAAKRNRNSGTGMVQHMDFDAGFCGPFAEFPQVEQQTPSQLVWWNAPFSN